MVPERLPPASGRAVARLLEGNGFVLVRQRGSHAHFRQASNEGGSLVTVPMHRSIGRKTLDGILDEVAFLTGISKGELIRRLRRL
ncbi:MAG: addiction module toxin, HicA family [SAR202 cluster bacterium]|nr:addiction module toxin, HicA family [SAR202 cluster bacterium]